MTDKRRLFWCLLSIEAVIALGYFILIQSSIYFVLASSDWQAKIKSVTSELAKTEAQLYELTTGVTRALALEEGYTEPTRKDYLYTRKQTEVTYHADGRKR